MGHNEAKMQSPNFSLGGKVAVVTGASRGIGRTIAIALAGAGAGVALVGREQQALQQVQETLAGSGCETLIVVADVTQLAAIDAAFEQIVNHFGHLDILINNAGVEQLCASRTASESLWDRIVDTNLKGAFFCAQAAARRMRPGGSILNLCSLTSEVGVAGAAAYGASKSGRAGLTRALATEWAADGIRVNGIGPGYFRTALTEPFYQNAQWQEHTLQKIPMRRFGQLEDLAGSAVFLCSEAAAYITGQILYVDGGLLAAL
jgi:NAD(P)-dependent dehydrogenase (short-subunit alcohol dehydrogenase family)